MKTLELTQRASADGKLHVEIPVDTIGPIYHLVVMVEEERAASEVADHWPPGYLEATIGQWQGESSVESEGPFEQREPL